MNKSSILIVLLASALSANAQKIDFNITGRQKAQVTADGFTPWESAVSKADGFPKNCVSDSMTVGGVTIVVQSPKTAKGSTIGCGWNKGITQTQDKLIGDGIESLLSSANGNTIKQQGQAGEIDFIVRGLTPGRHALLAYHNNPTGYVAPRLDVYVDGKRVLQGVEQTSNKERAAESGTSYVEFEVQKDRPVRVCYRAVPDSKTNYSSTQPLYTSSVFINGIEFDVPNIAAMARNPYPSDFDTHASCDDGTVKLTWRKAAGAVRHHLFFDTDPNNLEDKGILEDTTYTVSGLYSMDTYYWKVKEIDSEGKESAATVWRFQPRHLAFPGAEGYGRFAKGGRGGVVYHVTNLTNDLVPGSLRYGLTQLKGPRTIVFDVSGVIDMDFDGIFTDPNVTVAAQTAPGKGICLKHCNINFGNDNIVRFLRAHRGLGTPEQTGNAMGTTGAYNCIIDHVTAAWGTDETFSSRGAHTITFQKSMIAEALGIAHHKNYEDGKNHGFAATIGGNIGSFHHNLLVDCQGRNWSMGGGLDSKGFYDGRLDIFNNVCYNWGRRTTDGGAHEVNFVGNYYKEGPAVQNFKIFTLQLEGTGRGSQSAYLAGNILDKLDGRIITDQNEIKNVQVSKKQTMDWNCWGTEPYFPSYAKIDGAELAYKKVLSDVGANQPVMDDHDSRMIRETRDRSYTFTGSLSGIKGEIDNEQDAGGWENFPEEHRAANFDTDQDGIPDWYEDITGTDPKKPNNNADTNHDGYTELEDYLNFMAEEHRVLKSGESVEIDLKSLFAGFTKSPKYTFSYEGKNLKLNLKHGSLLKVKAAAKAKSLNSIQLTVTDADGDSYSRELNVAVQE